MGDPKEEDQRGAYPHEQPQGDAETSLPQRESHPAPHALVRPADKAVSLPLLLPEHLHDAEGAEDLVNHRQRRALEAPHVARLGAESRAIGPCDQEQRRRRRQRDQRELPIDANRHVDHAGQGHGRAHQRNEPVDHDGPDSWRVLLDAVHRVGGTDGVVVGERHPLEVTEDPRAELEL